MIKLDFTLDDKPGAYDDKGSERIRRQIKTDTFQGGQEFILNSRSFISCTTGFPVLWFAHELRLVMQWLTAPERRFLITIPDGGITLVFYKTKTGYVAVFPYPNQDQAEVVTHEELSRSIKRFYQRVYRRCQVLYPDMKKDEVFRAWLYEDYSGSIHGLGEQI